MLTLLIGQFSSEVYFVAVRILMGNRILLSSFLVLALSACAPPNMLAADPTEAEQNKIKYPFGENCEDAKYQLDKAVEGGQLSDLRVLKRNIELYCVWRRN
ncbi:MAG: hypothetical protein ACI8Z9_002287 [Paraglaciecola sp.]